MSFEERYCGVCDRKLKDEEMHVCERCGDKIAYETDQAIARFNQNEMPDHDESDVRGVVLSRYNTTARIARYCNYGGSCGNLIEGNNDVCTQHENQIRQNKEDEERRWNDFKNSI